MQDKKHILLVAPYVTFPDEMGMPKRHLTDTAAVTKFVG